MKSIMKKLFGLIKLSLYTFIQCTWGFLQSAFGFILFLKYFKCKHAFYHGAILTYHNGSFGGVSLGMFIFVNGNRSEKWISDATVHEYGHTIQSLVLGIFYLFVIGIPSVVWCNAKKFVKLRNEKSVLYSAFYPEWTADRLGAWAAKEPVPDWIDESGN